MTSQQATCSQAAMQSDSWYQLRDIGQMYQRIIQPPPCGEVYTPIKILTLPNEKRYQGVLCLKPNVFGKTYVIFLHIAVIASQ